jgi:hypothetical protein
MMAFWIVMMDVLLTSAKLRQACVDVVFQMLIRTTMVFPIVMMVVQLT